MQSHKDVFWKLNCGTHFSRKWKWELELAEGTVLHREIQATVYKNCKQKSLRIPSVGNNYYTLLRK